jgi:hypothetical protein
MPKKHWSDTETTEKWVWNKILAGEIADLNERNGLREPLDPVNPGGWDEKRVLSPAFFK